MEPNAQAVAADTLSLVESYVPTLVGAVILLVAGWFLAAYAARLVERGLAKTRIGSTIAGAVAEEGAAKPQQIERWTARAIFWLLMLFVIVGFFQVLGVSQITEPITRFLNRIFEYLPRLMGQGVGA